MMTINMECSEKFPGIDFREALARVDGNRNLLKKILWEFSNRYSHMSQDIEDALKENDVLLARRYSHTMKGVASLIGAMELYRISGELEMALKASDTERVPLLSDRFKASIAEVLNSAMQLEQMLQISEKQQDDALFLCESVDIRSDRIDDILKDLSDLLSKSSPKSESVFESLKSMLKLPNLTELIEQLECQIMGYDYKHALQTLKRLEDRLKVDIHG